MKFIRTKDSLEGGLKALKTKTQPMVSNVNLVLNSSVTQKYNLIFRFKRKNKKHLKCTLLPEIVAYILRGSCINNKHSIQQNTPEKKAAEVHYVQQFKSATEKSKQILPPNNIRQL